MSSASVRQPNFALLVVLAWLLIVIQLLLQFWPEVGRTLVDTDDAMRLTEVRSWLAGQGWFDLHLARVNPPVGYDSHWSRLIDAGLGGLFMLFHQVVDTAMAETLMRVTWPLLWILPVTAGTAAIAWRLAGREAALVVLLFAVIGLPAFQQFKPGRIDHHNVQITLAVLTVAAVAWSDRRTWTAWAAGAVTGLGLAIGFEGAPFLVLCGVALALRFLFDPRGAAPLRAYGLAIAASTVLGFLVSVGPDHWGHTACDTIAINSAAPVVIGGLLLALGAGAFGDRPFLIRCAAVAVAGAAAVAALAWIEPICLGGPYAMVDPAAKAVWLAHVREMQPLFTVLANSPLTALGLATFPAAALLATLLLALEGRFRNDFGFLVAAAALLLADATMVAAVKGYSYAMWLGMPIMAALAIRLFEFFRLDSLVPRFVAGMLLTPMVLSVGAISIANAAGVDETDNFSRGARQVCFDTASYAPLAREPAGLIMTDIDYGPFLLALTPHSVVAAPYHRLSSAIVTAYQAFALPPDQARRVIAATHADYVMTCGPKGPVGLDDAQRDASLWGRLHAGAIPDWLDLVAETKDQPLVLYRVKP